MSWPALYADIAYSTGWTIPHIREELDIPTVTALAAQWERYPPLPKIVAHWVGVARPVSAVATGGGDAVDPMQQDVIPSQRLSAEAFDDLLRTLKLPVSTEAPKSP